jgi:cysteine peptidase C11 family protein
MEVKDKQKWTLMFFFASDNDLSPSMLYQLKSIKTAGFQLQTNVLVHFDPHERGIPSTIFEINRTDKEGQPKSQIGDLEDPIVRDLAGDQVEPEISDDQFKHRRPSLLDELSAEEELTHFLEFCRHYYPAEKYMLFLVGHGLVVGRDAFLPDDNPNTGISLVELGNLLRNFSLEIDKKDETLELIGMHSCSMSAVEVAYQLKGTANYMMGSEGLSFVGAWPYRQMLQKIFYAIEKAGAAEVDVLDLMKNLHELCLHNSADFIFAGYSSDLCLCSLEPKKVEALSKPIAELSKALQAGLDHARAKELIQLAHLESQSYFQELYTDLCDFCVSLMEKCDVSDPIQEEMYAACKTVKVALGPARNEFDRRPILQADFFGPDCQYSYGLSIFFPWARPVEDANEHVIKNYRTYAFVTELGGASWLEFLEAYFDKTKRPKREVKIARKYTKTLKFATSMSRTIGARIGSTAYPVSSLTPGKTSPADASGDFSYSFIKNYWRDFVITERALKVFANEKGRKK